MSLLPWLLEDDLDAGEASRTVAFDLDGEADEIDLNEANAAQLREALAPFVGAARRRRQGSGPWGVTWWRSRRQDANHGRWGRPQGVRAWAEPTTWLSTPGEASVRE